MYAVNYSSSDIWLYSIRLVDGLCILCVPQKFVFKDMIKVCIILRDGNRIRMVPLHTVRVLDTKSYSANGSVIQLCNVMASISVDRGVSCVPEKFIFKDIIKVCVILRDGNGRMISLHVIRVLATEKYSVTQFQFNFLVCNVKARVILD